MKSIVLAGIFLFGMGLGAFGQEVSLGEAKAAWQKADKALNQVWKKAEATLSEMEFAELQLKQKEWLTYRDYRSEGAAVLEGGAKEGKETSSPEYWLMAEAITETRTKIIDAFINSETISDKTWTGVWEDGLGGHLKILEEPDGSILFLAHCVRGPSYHTGSIAGKARTNGLQARFSEKIPDGEANEEVWITFLSKGKYLELQGANTGYYHGMRAYFDGNYVRTSSKVDPVEIKKEIEP